MPLKISLIHPYTYTKFNQWPFFKKSENFLRKIIATPLSSGTALVNKTGCFIVLLTERQKNSIYQQFSLVNYFGTIAEKKNATILLVSGR